MANLTVTLGIFAFIIGGYLLYRQIKQRKQVEINLSQQTQRENLVNQIVHHIRESLNLEEVLVTTVADVQEFLKADRVLIYRIWADGRGSAITETVSPEYPTILGRSFPEEVFPRSYHQAYTLGKTRNITNIDLEDVESCLADFVKQFGVKSKLVVPILQQIRENNNNIENQNPYLWGLLIAHQCSAPRQWQTWEIELMKQLATQVAIAIQQSELYQQLQELNNQLENRVQQRTEELAITNQSLRAEIAERKRTEAALRYTNYTLQSLIEASPRAIFTLDLEDKVKIWNPAAERIFGWQETEVIDKTNPIISELAVGEYKTIKDSIIQGVTPPSLELRRPKKDGSLIDIIFSTAPLYDSEGNVSGMVVVVADITEQKHTEQALRRSEERFRSLIENALDIITILDTDGTIYYESPSVTKVLGYPVSQLIGQNFFAYIHPDDFVQTRYHITNDIPNSEIPPTIEFRYRHQDNSWHTLEAISQRFIDDIPEPRIVVNSRDITERKRLEEIRLALEKEKELSTLKTRFFSMASHEFRTPLSTALAAAQILENSQIIWENTEKRLRNLYRIQNSVKNMVQLLDDILVINRAEAGKLELNPELFNLEQYCRQFIEEIQLSSGSKHDLYFITQGEDPQVYLDQKLLRSILSNLLSNAIKYSPDGGKIDILLTLDINEIILQISDSGIGISTEDQKQLFDPFHRGKNVGNIAGTGLGLVVTKKCIDLHGGDITVTSELGVGTKISVTLQRIKM